MSWLLRQLRWKLFASHLSIIVIGLVVLLSAANFFARALPDESFIPTTLTLQDQFQLIVDQALLIAAFAALAATTVVSWFVSRRVVEPLQELSLVSRRLAQGYLHERTSIKAEDELADLSQSVNQLAEALEKTEQRRLGLITDVAHELRTPLTTIEGYMEGLIDGVIAPEPQIFAMVQHEATRLKWMIEEMALLSRMEAGQVRVEPQPLHLPELIQQVAAQFQPQITAQGLTLNLEVPPEFPLVLADADRVEQILINLLANALQYTPSGGAITVRAHPLDFMAHLSIHDTGIGLPAEHLPHIFERFYRVEKSRSRQHGGAGIGLTIARHLVYAHGGEIWVESAGVGQGSTFHFTLPLSQPTTS